MDFYRMSAHAIMSVKFVCDSWRCCLKWSPWFRARSTLSCIPTGSIHTDICSHITWLLKSQSEVKLCSHAFAQEDVWNWHKQCKHWHNHKPFLNNSYFYTESGSRRCMDLKREARNLKRCFWRYVSNTNWLEINVFYDVQSHLVNLFWKYAFKILKMIPKIMILSFPIHKTFVYLLNTNRGIFNET